MKPTQDELRSYLEQGHIEATPEAVYQKIAERFGTKAAKAAKFNGFISNHVQALLQTDADYAEDKLMEHCEHNSRNVHTFRFTYDGTFRRRVLIAPDMHWDNPKCDRKLLKKHLDEAKRDNAIIILPGDTFCLMQGAYDPRKNKSDIRPEHNKANYIDAVLETAVEFFGPYAENIMLVTRGNHETNILKRLETDVVQRFVDMMNMIHKPKNPVFSGGYGGWVRFQFQRPSGTALKTKRMKYYHGTGGGGVVTKGIIQNQRLNAFIEGADIIVNGHVHEDYVTSYIKEYLNIHGGIELRECTHIRASTYKEEYGDGFGGWHIERGAPPKPLGGAWLEFYYEEDDIKISAWKAK